MANLEPKNIGEVFQRNPSRYLPLTQFIQSVMRGESAFSPGQRELIAAYISGLNACQYCYGSHQAIATDLNVDPNLLEAILADLATAPLEARLRPVFAFVRKLTLTPAQIAKSDLDALVAAGWDSLASADLIDICALFNLMNRLVDAYGLETPNPEELEAMARGINDLGYDRLLPGEDLLSEK